MGGGPFFASASSTAASSARAFAIARMTSSTDGFGRRRSSFWATAVARDWTQNAASFVGQRFRPRAFWHVNACAGASTAQHVLSQ